MVRDGKNKTKRKSDLTRKCHDIQCFYNDFILKRSSPRPRISFVQHCDPIQNFITFQKPHNRVKVHLLSRSFDVFPCQSFGIFYHIKKVFENNMHISLIMYHQMKLTSESASCEQNGQGIEPFHHEASKPGTSFQVLRDCTDTSG